MKFTKMHGLGNDYVCINGFHQKVPMPEKLAVALCDRHYGIGADGMLLILPSEKADFKMELYNADGSSAGMCGNGTRCLGKYVFEHEMTTSHALMIETVSGLHPIYLHVVSDKVEEIKVDMGMPILNAHRIPIRSEKDIVFQEPIHSRVRVSDRRRRIPSLRSAVPMPPFRPASSAHIASSSSCCDKLTFFAKCKFNNL